MLDRQFVEALKGRFKDGKMRDLMEAYGYQFNAAGKTLCYMHDDKKPSLSAHPNYAMCKCFACGGKADPIEFIWRHSDAKNFPEAVKALAAYAGVEMPKDDNWKDQPTVVDEYKVFAKKIMAAAQKTPEAQAIMKGGQRINAAGIGYLPEVIKSTNWVNFLKKQSKEFLDLAGIERDGDVFAGGARYIWELTNKFEPVGFVRFGKNPKETPQVKTRDNKPGYALGEGKSRQWNTFKSVNVTNNVYDAVKIHNTADAWGPGLFYPYEQFPDNTQLGEDMARHFFRNTGLRYVSYDKTDIMRFITHVLPIVQDDQLVKFVHPAPDEAITRENMKYAVTMSSFIRRFILDNPDKQDAYIKRIIDVVRQNNNCTFYKDLLIMNLQDLQKEKAAPAAETAPPTMDEYYCEDMAGDLPGAEDFAQAEEEQVAAAVPARRTPSSVQDNGR